MPMTPILSKQPSLKVWSCTYDSSCKYVPSSPFPRYQNAASHAASPQASNTQAAFRWPVCAPPVFSPAPDTIECISRAGVATTSRNRSEGSVSLSASVRVARFPVLVISQKISSARTAERAMLIEKMTAERDRTLIRRLLTRAARPCVVAPDRRASLWCGLRSLWPESTGNSFWETPSATTRNVRRKGSAEMIVFTGPLETKYSGTHSSQSSSSGTMGAAVLGAEERRCCEGAVILRRVRKGGLYVHGTRVGSQSLGCMNITGVPLK